ncbi:MAG: NAD(P)H-dependent oxidoreductase subunit E [Bacteroidota bacterium]|nr:NAD(P)H-dependent oxidoreductase subunit E [Bacteroidota bacterium]
MSKNLSHLSGRKELTENLFEYIGQLSEQNGALSKEDTAQIADEYLMGTANIFGTASFYDFTRSTNQGKKVYLCNGSACLNAGTQESLKKEMLQFFSDDEIGEMCCLGRCHENAAFHYKGINFSGDSHHKIASIKNGEFLDGMDHYQTKSFGATILTGPEMTISDAINFIKFVLTKSPQDCLNEIKISGIRGRGGAGFPMHIKLDGCAKQKGPRKFIVCNADEGDPGSYSDRYLLEEQAFLVLLGMMVAGYVSGADRGVVYIRAEYPESVQIIIDAVELLRTHDCLGDRIFGSEFDFEFKVIKAQGAYICGEETALLSSIEGQRPEVRVRPPFPVQEGLFRKPTVVNNVETLANLPFIINNGGMAFAMIGTAKSTGTKLVSLDGAFNTPGVYEVDMGTSLNIVIYELGGGFKRKVKAIHIGGPLGGLVPIFKIDELSIDFESFAGKGFMLGHASMVSVPEEFPMIKYLEHLFAFTAHESCGKCFPCRIGSVRGKELLAKAQSDLQYKIDINLMTDLLDTMKRGSLCALGGGIPLPVYNALEYFKEELEPYFKG